MHGNERNGRAEPLADITVVEIGTSVAGPFAGQIFADLGAEVIKVEKPVSGDDARQWGPPFVDDIASVFHTLNRNKKSVTVDFKDGSALKRLRNFIVKNADVVIQNMRPGLMNRFGLGSGLIGENKALIYCDIGAYGHDGPMKEKAGYDPLMQAFGGLMSVTGEEGRPPVRIGTSIVDMGAGMWTVIGVLAALHRRSLTGRGGLVETSLLETTLTWMSTHVASYLSSGSVPGRGGSEHPALAPYKAYKAADEYFVIAVGNDELFKRLCDALNISSLAEDPKFRTNPDRVNNRVELNSILNGILAARERGYWLNLLDTAGVPCAPLQNIEEALSHEQVIATGIRQSVPESAQDVVGIPLRFDGQRLAIRSKCPTLGKQNSEILGDS